MMRDRYGEEIVEGSLLVTKENSGPNPGRVWLGVVKRLDNWRGLCFVSSNMAVALHENQSDYWQVVFPPEGFTYTVT